MVKLISNILKRVRKYKYLLPTAAGILLLCGALCLIWIENNRINDRDSQLVELNSKIAKHTKEQSPSSKPTTTPSTNAQTNDTSANPGETAVHGPVSTTPTTAQPSTLSTCTFTNGSNAGQECPLSPPPSYSYSSECLGDGGESVVPTCPPYDYVISITGAYQPSNYPGDQYVCRFGYSAYNGATGIFLQDVVTPTNDSQLKTTPDCSIEPAR